MKSKAKNQAAASLGKLGGEAVKRKYGINHFSELGKKGMAKRWSGRVKQKADGGVELVFKCPACSKFYKAKTELLSEVTCPFCKIKQPVAPPGA